MEQGNLTSNCYTSLSPAEQLSLTRIRDWYSQKPLFSFSIEDTLSFIDRAYESMGRAYRNRINTQTIKLGRYTGELDGVSLIIADALRLYDYSACFHPTPSEAVEVFRDHKKSIKFARKKLNSSFSDITLIINGLLPSVLANDSKKQLANALTSLDEIRLLLEKNLDLIDFGERSDSRAEAFVNGVCMHLVWSANIRPTKPTTDSYKKTPLLRFLEVFYPVEASSILAKIYDQERGLPSNRRIGATFIAPK
ncbi:hypothetical protein LOY46_09205 [Pseudomonas sichuanensis]|uniref:hypothetical protein n=1 Tax=Pseudomonas sichuanensis TaxID=2213015 RepID=UPI002160612E|nr:hypothetical protein [Pseudomonas sichuanensis]UVK84841.1 hypothetical protein LOY46_09205 [Pseudomonas sichuanensis]UVL91047.1 hypothetical protein LOY51_09275 [Pseudomonas sichuanensis]